MPERVTNQDHVPMPISEISRSPNCIARRGRRRHREHARVRKGWGMVEDAGKTIHALK